MTRATKRRNDGTTTRMWVLAAIVAAIIGAFWVAGSAPAADGPALWRGATGSFTMENRDIGGFVATAAKGEKGVWAPLGPDGGKDRQVIFRNNFIHDITREPGVHTDAFWIATDAADVRTTITLEGNRVSRIDGGGVLFEGGSGRLVFKGNTFADIGYPRDIIIKCWPGRKLWVVLDSQAGRVQFDLRGGAKAADVIQEIWALNFKGSIDTIDRATGASSAGVPGVVIKTMAAPATQPAGPTVAELQGQVAQLKADLAAAAAQVRTLTDQLAESRASLARWAAWAAEVPK